MVSFSYAVATHVRNLVGSLTKKNTSTVYKELSELYRSFGEDARIFFLRCLLEDMDFRSNQRDHPKFNLLSTEMLELSGRSDFGTILCRAAEGLPLTAEFLPAFSSAYQLSLPLQVALGLAFSHSIDERTRAEGTNFVRAKLVDALDPSAPRLPDFVLQDLAFFVRTDSGLTPRQQAKYLERLQNLYPDNFRDVSMSPLLYTLHHASFPPRTAPLNPNDAITADSITAIQSWNHLADLIQDMGYLISEIPNRWRELLSLFPSLSELDVARIVSMMVRTSSGLADDPSVPVLEAVLPSLKAGPVERKDASSWKYDVFVSTILESHPRLNWNEVYQNLDLPDFHVPDARGFALLIDVYRLATKRPTVPLDIFFKEWRNKQGHFSLLFAAVYFAGPATESLSFLTSPRVQAPLEGLSVQSTKGGDAAGDFATIPAADLMRVHHPWFSIDLLETLLRLSESEVASGVKRMLLHATERCPEVLFCGLAQIKTVYSQLRDEMLSLLAPKYLNGHRNAGVVFRRLWRTNPELAVEWMSRVYAVDRTVSNRIWDLIAEEKDTALAAALQSPLPIFALEVAVLASQNNVLSLPNWLQSRHSDGSNVLVQVAIEYLKEIAPRVDARGGKPGDSGAAESKAGAPVTGASVRDILAFLRTAAPKSEEIARFEKDYATAISSASDAAAGASFSDEVAKRSNVIFQEIYQEKISVPDAVAMLRRFKTSEDAVEREICGCMLHSLFDEYRFLHKYPFKELQITGVLFGMLIQNQVVQNFTLGIALRYVLEALRKPPESKYFKFGMWALREFKNRVHLFQQYCELLLQIPHLRAAAPDLVQHIESVTGQKASGSNVPPLTPSVVAGLQQQPATVADARTNIADQRVVNVTLEASAAGSAAGAGDDGSKKPAAAAKVDVSEEWIEDKTHFLFNGLTKSNVRQKAKELKSWLKPEYYPYLAGYVIKKRVIDQGNFHALYLAFIDALNIDQVYKLMVDITVDEAKKYLQSKDIVETKGSNDRILVKNLGAWLGMITLGKKKPLLARKLDLKELLLDAYGLGRLQAVLPFVAAVLQSANRNKIFKPPNPWTMSLLALLREIYDAPNIKLNWKFEIENVFKVFELNMRSDTIKVTNLLKDRVVVNNVAPSISATSLPSAAGAGIAGDKPDEGARGTDYASDARHGEVPPSASPPPTGGAPADVGGFPLVPVINPNIVLFQQFPRLTQYVAMAIDRATREIINPVVDRSVTIASVTAQQLVTKDYNFEPDENKMRRGAHQMVQYLASSLALVTCKEPLRVAIQNHLGTLLDSSLPGQGDRMTLLIENAATTVSGDNVEVGCAIIERAAAERATREIDDALAAEYACRRKFREQQQQQPYARAEAFSSIAVQQQLAAQAGTTVVNASLVTTANFMPRMPMQLRPKPSGLSADQLQVYEDFRRQPESNLTASTSDTLAGAPVARTGSTPQMPNAPYGAPNQSASPTNITMSPNESPLHFAQGGRMNVGQFSLTAAGGGGGAADAAAMGQPAQFGMDRARVLKELAQWFTALDNCIGRFPVQGKGLTWHALSEAILAHKPPEASPAFATYNEMKSLLSAVGGLLSQYFTAEPSDTTLLMEIARRTYTRILVEGRPLGLAEDTFLHILRMLQNLDRTVQIIPDLTRTVGNIVTYVDRLPLYRDLILRLASARFIDAKELLNNTLSKLIMQSNNAVIVEFTMVLLRQVMVKDEQVPVSQLADVLTALHHIYTSGDRRPAVLNSLMAELVQLLSDAEERFKRQNGVPQAGAETKAVEEPPLEVYTYALSEQLQRVDQVPWEDAPEPPGMAATVLQSLDDWVAVCTSEYAVSEKHFSAFVASLYSRNLMSDDNMKAYFRLLNTAAIDKSNASFKRNPEDLKTAFQEIDAVTRLIGYMVRFDNLNARTNLAKVQLLNGYLFAAWQALYRDHSLRRENFNQRPWLRLLSGLLHELNTPDPNIDSNHPGVLLALGACFHALRPARVPAFAFAWLELISHRMFFPKLVLRRDVECARALLVLLTDLFSFQEPYLRNMDFTDGTRTMYRASLRLLAVLAHDFPEFVADNHLALCLAIPLNCFHARTIVLAAVPKMANLIELNDFKKIDTFAEMSQPCRINADLLAPFDESGLRNSLENFLNVVQGQDPSGRSAGATPNLVNAFLLEAMAAKGGRLDLRFLHALVLLVANKGIQLASSPNSGMVSFSSVPDGAFIDLLYQLLCGLDSEGRYLFLNAVADQLRFPNTHTHYFSVALLHFFAAAKDDFLREQITRILIERALVRPDPWGIHITMRELCSNPKYRFWQQACVSGTPDSQRLFVRIAEAHNFLHPGARAASQ